MKSYYYEKRKSDMQYIKDEYQNQLKDIKRIEEICNKQKQKCKRFCDKIFFNNKPISKYESIDLNEFIFDNTEERKFFLEKIESYTESNILKIRFFILKELDENIENNNYLILIRIFSIIDRYIQNNNNNFKSFYLILKEKDSYANKIETISIVKNEIFEKLNEIKEIWIDFLKNNNNLLSPLFIYSEDLLNIIICILEFSINNLDNIKNVSSDSEWVDITLKNIIAIDSYYKYLFEIEISSFIEFKNFIIDFNDLNKKNIKFEKGFEEATSNIRKIQLIENVNDKFKELEKKCNCEFCKKIENLFNKRSNSKRNVFIHNKFITLPHDFSNSADKTIDRDKQPNDWNIYLTNINLIVSILEKNYWWFSFIFWNISHSLEILKKNKK